jgi:quinol monooxygenase YgiN
MFTQASIVAPQAPVSPGERITMFVTIDIKPEYQVTHTKALIDDDVLPARKEEGNLFMRVYQDKQNQNRIYLFEQWKNQDGLNTHFQTPYIEKIVKLNETALQGPFGVLFLKEIFPLSEKKQKKLAETSVSSFTLFKVKDNMQENFIEQFESVIQKNRNEAGNLAYQLYAIIGDSTQFLLFQRWEDQKAFDTNQTQTHMKELSRSLQNTLKVPLQNSLLPVTELVK